jgi:hypothetical protein
VLRRRTYEKLSGAVPFRFDGLAGLDLNVAATWKPHAVSAFQRLAETFLGFPCLASVGRGSLWVVDSIFCFSRPAESVTPSYLVSDECPQKTFTLSRRRRELSVEDLQGQDCGPSCLH